MNDIIEYRERFAALNPTFRVGIVQQQDTARAKVRVVFPDYDEVISWRLPVVFSQDAERQGVLDSRHRRTGRVLDGSAR